MRHSFRNSDGRFAPLPRRTANQAIVAGRLYNFNGIIVRARKRTNNNMWLVSLHKRMNGFAKESELSVINRDEVNRYLNKA